jgi:hypothetical protein
MRWTTEKKKLWIKTYLATGGQVYVHRIRKGLTNVTFGITKTGMMPLYEITFGVLHANKRGDIVASRRAKNRWGQLVSYPGSFYSVVKAVQLAARITDTSETTSPGASFPVRPSISLQTRGILPPHVIDVLFARLRERLV